MKLTRLERNEKKQALVAEIEKIQQDIKVFSNKIPDRIINGSANSVQEWRINAEHAYYRGRFQAPSMKKSLSALEKLLASEKLILASVT